MLALRIIEIFLYRERAIQEGVVFNWAGMANCSTQGVVPSLWVKSM